MAYWQQAVGGLSAFCYLGDEGVFGFIKKCWLWLTKCVLYILIASRSKPVFVFRYILITGFDNHSIVLAFVQMKWLYYYKSYWCLSPSPSPFRSKWTQWLWWRLTHCARCWCWCARSQKKRTRPYFSHWYMGTHSKLCPPRLPWSPTVSILPKTLGTISISLPHLILASWWTWYFSGYFTEFGIWTITAGLVNVSYAVCHHNKACLTVS